MNDLNTAELLSIISQKKTYIYGAGFVAERFYWALKNKNLEGNVCAFVTTDKYVDNVCDKPVVVFEDIKKNLTEDCFICVAVFEVGYKQIKDLLISNNINNFVWIYPNIHELFLGEKLEKNVSVSVSYLLKHYLNDYAIPIRYMAIGQYYGENEVGYNLYLKGMGLHCTKDTAEERLYKFQKLIREWENHGYNKNITLKVTDDANVIDGAHRLALALYFGEKELYCDVYSDENYKNFITDNVRISEKDSKIFNSEELKVLDEVRDYMKSKADMT